MATSTTAKGYIYVLRPLVQIDGHEVVKIGMTTRSVEQRVRELQTGSMVSLDIAYTLSVENPRDIEKRLHAMYHSRRIHGGGQEFFRVSAQEVIQDLERIATSISRQRAIDAFAAEFNEFKKQIGATRLETLLVLPIAILFLPLWGASIWAVGKLAYSTIGSGAMIIAGFCTFMAAPVLLSIGWTRLEKILNELIIEPRFGNAIDQKREELYQKYPLARWPYNSKA